MIQFIQSLKQLNKFTKSLLIIGLAFIIYGYLCRIIELYFFWESRSIGWLLLLFGAIGILSFRIRNNLNDKNKSLHEKVGIGVIVFILLMQSILFLIIQNSDAFTAAKKHIINDSKFKNEVGKIVGFGLTPIGGIQKKTDSSGEYGNATLKITVKGTKKYKDITVYVIKTAESPKWIVEGIE